MKIQGKIIPQEYGYALKRSCAGARDVWKRYDNGKDYKKQLNYFKSRYSPFGVKIMYDNSSGIYTIEKKVG